MKKLVFAITFCLLFLISCEKELEFSYHPIEPQLVIEGLLTHEGAMVSLTETTPMDEKIENRYLSDGNVFLIEVETGRQIELTADSYGIFKADYAAAVGREYGLEVTRQGKKYLSKCRLRAPTEIVGLKFQWIKMPYDYVAVLQISFKDLESEDDCYWLKLYRNEEPYKWILSDDRSAVNGIITEVTMTSRKDLEEEDEKDILRDGDEVKVEINAISREMYDYLGAIQNDSNGPRMFEGDFCLGYFMASDRAEDTIIYHPDELSQYE